MADTFITCLVRVLVSLCFFVPGFILCKCKKASANHLSTLSTILVYVCSPCMIIYAFYQAAEQAEISGLSKGDMGLKMLYFGLVTFALQALFMFGLFLIFHKKYEDARYRMLTCSSVLGNVGFFGLPLVQALVADPIVSCYSSIYVVSMNMLVFTVGVFCLTKDKKYISLKAAIINPATLSLFIAIPVFILGATLNPNKETAVFWDGINLLGKMTTPVCMLILGVRLGACNFKSLWTRPFVYVITGLKMTVFPLFCYLCVVFLPFFDDSFKSSILILSSVPCASVILNLAEMHHSEEETAANCIMVSTLLCFITIPLVTLLLNI